MGQVEAALCSSFADDGRVIGATGGRLIDEVDGVVITPSGEETDVIVVIDD